MAVGAWGRLGRFQAWEIPFWLHTAVPLSIVGLEAAALTQGRPFHDAFFSGEFGIYEVGTVGCALLAAIFAARALLERPRFAWTGMRVWLALVALGSFYLAGEEASWGQHVFGWKAGPMWSEVNEQHETNLHNLREFAFTNEVPRNLLTVLASIGLLTYGVRVRRNLAKEEPTRLSYWVLPGAVCLTALFLVLIPPIPKKLGLPSLPEPGETEEFFMSFLLMVYAASIFLRKRRFLTPMQDVSSVA